MPADYPAAHSMDTEWFAVDADGCVATCWSSENGSVPHGAGQVSHDLVDLVGEENLFAYGYQDEYGYPMPLGVYRRDAPPARPVHLYELPAGLRREVALIRFPAVRFAESETFQPAESRTCSWWGGDTAAYLAGDAVTFRPMPNREREFFGFAVAHRREMADLPRRFEFAWDGRTVAVLGETGWLVRPVPGQEDGFLELVIAYQQTDPNSPLRFEGVDEAMES